MKLISQYGKDLLSSAELARAIDVGASTLEKWRASGKGPAFRKYGSRVFYRRATVVAWMNEQDDDGDSLGELRAPYNQGYEAASNGSPEKACPYMTVVGEFKLRTAWIAGWHQHNDEQGAAHEAA